MRLRGLLLMSVTVLLSIVPAVGAAAPFPQGPACPRHDRQPLISHAPGASTALVPGHPQSLLLCRYSGLQGRGSQRLLGQRLVRNRYTVGHLAAALNALPPVTGVQACPADDGSAIIAFFRYRSGPDNPVAIDLTGCRLTTNGYVHREAGTVADDLRRLSR